MRRGATVTPARAAGSRRAAPVYEDEEDADEESYDDEEEFEEEPTPGTGPSPHPREHASYQAALKVARLEARLLRAEREAASQAKASQGTIAALSARLAQVEESSGAAAESPKARRSVPAGESGPSLAQLAARLAELEAAAVAKVMHEAGGGRRSVSSAAGEHHHAHARHAADLEAFDRLSHHAREAHSPRLGGHGGHELGLTPRSSFAEPGELSVLKTQLAALEMRVTAEAEANLAYQRRCERDLRDVLARSNAAMAASAGAAAARDLAGPPPSSTAEMATLKQRLAVAEAAVAAQGAKLRDLAAAQGAAVRETAMVARADAEALAGRLQTLEVTVSTRAATPDPYGHSAAASVELAALSARTQGLEQALDGVRSALAALAFRDSERQREEAAKRLTGSSAASDARTAMESIASLGQRLRTAEATAGEASSAAAEAGRIARKAEAAMAAVEPVLARAKATSSERVQEFAAAAAARQSALEEAMGSLYAEVAALRDGPRNSTSSASDKAAQTHATQAATSAAAAQAAAASAAQTLAAVQAGLGKGDGQTATQLEALAQCVETFVTRLEALERDTANAVSSLAQQLAAMRGGEGMGFRASESR